jgi:tyrosyl-tRNA synthetase
MTEMLHGTADRELAEAASAALFSGEVAALPEAVLAEVFASVPRSEHGKERLSGDGVSLVDALVETTLVKSKREAREFLGNGSISVNGRKAGPEERLTTADLLHGSVIALRRGKKAWHVTRWR